MTIFPPGVAVPTTTTVPGAPVNVNTPSVAAGGQLTVSGSGWKPNSTVQIILNSTPVGLGTANVNVEGNFSKVVTIPADTAPGAHTIVLVGTNAAGIARQVSRAITVTAATGTGTGGTGELPRTGSPAFPMTLVGVTLMAAGLLLVLSQRRRFARR
jgi:LPXTG-motif cell wall-anchored protein